MIDDPAPDSRSTTDEFPPQGDDAKRRDAANEEGGAPTEADDDDHRSDPAPGNEGDRMARRYEAKFARGEPGTGAEVLPDSQKEMDYILGKSRFGMSSADRNTDLPPEMELTDEQIIDRYNQLRRDLVAFGFKFTPITQKNWGIVDKYVLLVHGITKEELADLGEKYRQQSVVFVDHGMNQLLFTLDTVMTPGKKCKWGYRAPEASSL